ncbi:MAG: lipid-A-disaccharide synthase [Ignavibacteriaceae bacterium]|nr:lipid-A-disaccharide synthase [Chlorobium sp.]MCW8816366.1 lipid-A-disaccharide synthase [Ignavibacteriaceae bacterium]MCW8822525.1 lipid-A-disaccharide synthase [Ignavibacteriaceae bacterium]MCW9098373.1 lipid-A-disaccharide synthase [Ignavibacteriaceae bacterium]
MSESSKKLMIITGEVSGDLIGAALVKELKSLKPHLNIIGIGGDKMREEGMELIYHSDQMAFLGFIEVVKHLPFIRKVQKKLIDVIKDEEIKHVVLIDYPGFNLSIAKKLKPLGVKVIYYVSPQIWAWAKGRIKKVKKYVDKMLLVFPFEAEFYGKENIDVEFVGHPLVERVSRYKFINKNEFYSKFKLELDKEILLVMPGSRKQEVKEIFPEAIKAAGKLANKFNLQVVVARSKNIDEKYLRQLSGNEKFVSVEDHNYELMKYSRFGIIKSGTSTLEAGYFSLPMVIIYKTSPLTYLIGKQLVKLDRIGMVNILLNEMVVPELIQNKASAVNIFNEASNILSDNQIYEDMKLRLGEVKNKLGGEGASEKAARSILGILNES